MALGAVIKTLLETRRVVRTGRVARGTVVVPNDVKAAVHGRGHTVVRRRRRKICIRTRLIVAIGELVFGVYLRDVEGRGPH